jgi:broad specificity phosphatase PhoE/ribonuclease HI
VSRRLRVEADGGSRGNPGVAGYGALVRDVGTGAVLAERAQPLGVASNNVAEYSGLIAGLQAARDIEPGGDVEVVLDSRLVVEQMSGRWKVKHEDMRRLAREAQEVAEQIRAAGGRVSYRWVPREQNRAADALSNKAMDGETIDRLLGDSSLDEVPAPEPELTASRGVGGPAAPPWGTPTRIVLVRHGVTDFTDAGRLDGRGGADPPLNASGLTQAAAAGRAVAQLVAGHPSAVVPSSLVRARETGALVAEALRVVPTVDPAWDEQNFGDWDGAGIGELVRDHPDALDLLRRDPAYRRPGGESHEEMAERVLAAYARAVAAGGTTVVVCHRKPIMVVLAHLLAIPHDRMWRLAAAPGSLTAIEAWGNGTVSVAFTNRT